MRVLSHSRQHCGIANALRFAGVVLLLLQVSAFAEKIEQLKPSNYVNDFAGVLAPGTVTQLNAMLKDLQEKTGAQIALVTVKSLEGIPKEDYGNRLFKAWGVGGKKDDRGVLVLLAPNDRQYWVEVGYGLEPILPDGKVGGFGREMVPLLKANDYSGAMSLMTTRIAQTIADDAKVSLSGAPELRKRRQVDDTIRLWGIPIPYFVFLFVFFLLLRSLLGFGGRKRRGILWMGGGGGGWGGGGFGGGGGGGGFGGFGGGMSGGGGAGGSW